MDSKKIEISSIKKFEHELERSERIITHINANDTIPSWDGEIFLYNTSAIEKGNIRGKIPVQIKGKKVEKADLRKNEISYPVEVADLKNFRNFGGTIFFVVYIVDYDNYKIYYNSLVPLDLEKIISKIAKGQKNKSVKLLEFPINDIDLMEYLLYTFLESNRKQHSTARVWDIKAIKFDSFKFSASPKYMFKVPTYFYGEISGIYIPIGKHLLKSIGVNNIEKEVKIDDEVFYKKISIEKNNNDEKIRFGAGFTITINNEKHVNLNYVSTKGYLEERIQDLNFLRELLKRKILKIGNVLEARDFEIKGIEYIEQDLEFYKGLQNFLISLKIQDKLDLDTLTEVDYEALDIIQKAIMNKIPVYLNGENEKIIWIKYKIGNLTIALFGEKTNHGKYTIKNLFDVELGQCKWIWRFISDDKMEEIPSCIYVLLKKQDFLELSNICYENMLEKLLSVSYSKEYGETVSCLMLEMLSAFDEKKQEDFKMLDNIIIIAKWLNFQESNNYLFELNYLQSIRRMRNLDKEELNKLQKMKENEIKKRYDLYILSGISILLENKTDFLYYFDKMKPEDKETFVKWPIYKLTHHFEN